MLLIINLLNNLSRPRNGHRYDEGVVAYAFALETLLGPGMYAIVRAVCAGALPDTRT